MSIESEFLSYSGAKLEQLVERIEACVALLTPEQIWTRGGEQQNAIGNLMLHLTGNLRQWILTGIAAAPNNRNRDSEFAARGGVDPAELTRGLRETVDRAVQVIRSLPSERLMEHATIQGHDITLLEAIYHVVEHFSGHTAQIILMTKAFTNRSLDFYSYLSQPGSGADRTP